MIGGFLCYVNVKFSHDHKQPKATRELFLDNFEDDSGRKTVLVAANVMS